MRAWVEGSEVVISEFWTVGGRLLLMRLNRVRGKALLRCRTLGVWSGKETLAAEREVLFERQGPWRLGFSVGIHGLR